MGAFNLVNMVNTDNLIVVDIKLNKGFSPLKKNKYYSLVKTKQVQGYNVCFKKCVWVLCNSFVGIHCIAIFGQTVSHGLGFLKTVFTL